MTKIKVLSDSRATLAALQANQTPETKQVIAEAIQEASSVDGDRVLDQFEAEAIKQAFESVATPGQPLAADKVGEFKSALSLRIQEMKTERVKSSEVIFTSEGKALERFRTKILGSIQDTIDKANGRPADVNMMIFSFTDKIMADAVVDMARENPNVNFRLLTDWSQLATSGNRQAPRLAKIAKDEGLTNLDIKFKKDSPYVWNSRTNRPGYNHGSTKGLNHHKGFVTLIDGRPEKMTFGSFNWSVSAMKSNYENLMLLDRGDPDNRRIMAGYEKEFEGFWNNDGAALTFNEARAHKNDLYKALYTEHGQPYTPYSVPQDSEPDPIYVSEDKNAAFDLNSFGDQDSSELYAVTGKRLGKKIQKELRDYGRFDSWPELVARVPDVAKASAWVREQLMENLDYGDGGLSINSATAEELDRAGLSKRQAQRVVDFRDQHGAFESVDELDDIPGIGKSTLRRIKGAMNADEIIGTYSARVPGGEAKTGWSEDHHGNLAVPKNAATADDDALAGVTPGHRTELEEIDRNLAAPVIDLLRRTEPGQTFRLAMYGLSTSSPEYKELARAIGRGVKVRVVIYNAYNSSAIDALTQFKDEGLDVDLRIIKSRVMHEKFGVVGDDSFNGSANMSSSSITKHSEDRFMFRNQPEVADRYVEEFARLWEKGKASV